LENVQKIDCSELTEERQFDNAKLEKMQMALLQRAKASEFTDNLEHLPFSRDAIVARLEDGSGEAEQPTQQNPFAVPRPDVMPRQFNLMNWTPIHWGPVPLKQQPSP